MAENLVKIKVNTSKIVLSSESCLYKTESFLKKTKYLSNIDFFLSKIAEGLIKNISSFALKQDFKTPDLMNCFQVETEDKAFVFLIKMGGQLTNLNQNDLVFFDYLPTGQQLRQNDQRLNDYLKLHSTFNICVKSVKNLVKKEEFEKLYLLSNSSGINLPKLTTEQLDIVRTMDQNVVVQGVAGSGKTNVCIDKIIFSSCQNYGGRLLYSTYSRGLLMDTELKIDAFKRELIDFEKAVKENNVEFLDANHKRALENKFGIFFFSDDDEKIFEKINKIIDFLENKIDYFLIEDIYRKNFNNKKTFADEKFFMKNFVKENKNHQLSKAFKKVEKYSFEVLYKEIFGMIFGNYADESSGELLSEEEYISKRTGSFSKEECIAIFQLAKEYANFLKLRNLTNLNFASKELIKKVEQEYSLTILDEVQDFSQANLFLFKKLSLKLFCVGDALQMINPSFFNFAHLKNMLFLPGEMSVKHLRANFRNTKKLEEVINSLGEINKSLFGTHNFVVKGVSVDSTLKTTAVSVFENDFASKIAAGNFDNFTFVTADDEKKNKLKTILKNQEVLTVSEIKGLERSTVVAYNLLSDNFLKWSTLQQGNIDRKQADENSVYRYYFNLFYVGITRAKQNLFVVENKKLPLFESFFKENFDKKTTSEAITLLSEIVSHVEFTENEMLERIGEFLRLEQFENATWTANKILDDVSRLQQLTIIDIHEKFIKDGRHREAGIQFWEKNLIERARDQFRLSGDDSLLELLDACSGNTSGGLDIDIVNYFPDVAQNETAKNLILRTITSDRENLKEQLREIKENFKKGGN